MKQSASRKLIGHNKQFWQAGYYENSSHKSFWVVSGHDFQSCQTKRRKDQGFSPCQEQGPQGLKPKRLLDPLRHV